MKDNARPRMFILHFLVYFWGYMTLQLAVFKEFVRNGGLKNSLLGYSTSLKVVVRKNIGLFREYVKSGRLKQSLLSQFMSFKAFIKRISLPSFVYVLADFCQSILKSADSQKLGLDKEEDYNFYGVDTRFLNNAFVPIVETFPDSSYYTYTYILPSVKIGSFLYITSVSLGPIKELYALLETAKVSVKLICLYEILGYSLEKSYLIKHNKAIRPENVYGYDMLQITFVPLAEAFPDPVYYTYKYVIPSLQFTAIFQVGGVALGVFSSREVVSFIKVPLKIFFAEKPITGLVRGGIKATSSLIIIVKNKWSAGESIYSSDFLIPYSKEPVVSVCKVVLDNWPDLLQKSLCNVVGEATHNTAKWVANKQKLSLYEAAKIIPSKACWKSVHQFAEDLLTKKMGLGGYYLGSVVTRSWGNDFIENVLTGNLEINNILSLQSNLTYYGTGVAVMAGAVAYHHLLAGAVLPVHGATANDHF